MVKEVNVKSIAQVKKINEISTRYDEDMGVHDKSGAIADAKSMLGLLSLDYSQPVLLVSEDEKMLRKVFESVTNFVS